MCFRSKINRNHSASGLKKLFLLLAISLSFSFSVRAQQKPNVLLVLSDDHSYPHLGCYGDANVLAYNITPNLDAFAKQGMRFERAYTTAPQCAPSRISIFTGRNPVSIDVTRFAEPARREVEFFTDILRRNGYWVGIDGRHHHLDGKVKEAAYMEKILAEQGMKDLENRFDHVARMNTKGEGLEKVPAKIDSILENIPGGKPFFLYFGFNQPHRSFEDDYEEIDPEKLVLPPDFVDLPEIRKDYARFLSELRDMDWGFGSIMKILEERGLAENTLVIFMGDNGESLLRGKGTVNGRGIHVPLLIRWPGMVRENSECRSLISGVDLAPTILEAIGLSFGEDISGQSFMGALAEDEKYKGRRYVFGERGWHAGPLMRTDGFDLSRSVTSERFHFIYNALPEQEFAPVDMVKTEAWREVENAFENQKLSKVFENLYFYDIRPVFELYDLKTDPFELHNLAGNPEYAEIEKEHRQQMDRMMLIDHDYLPLPSYFK